MDEEGIEQRDAMRRCGEIWRNMSDEEKRPYEDLWLQD